MTITYNDFSKVEKQIKASTPKRVYKYRNWKEDNHKDVLKNNILWFSHPYDLNDPLDCRPELSFSEQEINSPDFFHKLFNNRLQHLRNIPHEAAVAASLERWEEIKRDPALYFEQTKRETECREKYNNVGVWSSAIDELSLQLWKGYGDNDRGYCLGYNTVELCRETQCSDSFVLYSDSPYPFRFIHNKEDENFDMFRYKKLKWSYEKEFRLFTSRIGFGFKNLFQLSSNVIEEIILGKNISPSNEEEITAIAKKRNLEIYKIVQESNHYSKQKI